MNVALRPQPDALTLISQCTGGGGLDLAVELAIPSARPVLYVEREAFAVAHLVEAIENGRMAPAPIWSNARTVPGRRVRGLVDLVIGGIPCQPHSSAGKQLGADDERDLWSPTRRLLVQCGAWGFLLENVAGMLSTGGAERVWRDLQRLGFEVEGGLFSAEEVGAPHGRERLFILGVADARRHGQLRSAQLHIRPLQSEQRPSRRDDAHRCDLDVGDADSGRRDGRPESAIGSEIGRAFAERPSGVPVFPPGPAQLDHWCDALKLWPEAEPAVRGMADGMADRVDRLRLLGNGVVPLQAAYALRTLATRLAARSAGAALLVRLMGES